MSFFKEWIKNYVLMIIVMISLGYISTLIPNLIVLGIMSILSIVMSIVLFVMVLYLLLITYRYLDEHQRRLEMAIKVMALLDMAAIDIEETVSRGGEGSSPSKGRSVRRNLIKDLSLPIDIPKEGPDRPQETNQVNMPEETMTDLRMEFGSTGPFVMTPDGPAQVRRSQYGIVVVAFPDGEEREFDEVEVRSIAVRE